MKPTARLLIALALLLGCQGCLLWPFPTGTLLAGRGRIQQQDQTAFVVGRTTREEVVLKLGEPDGVEDGGRIWLYRWTQDAGFFALVGQSTAVVIPFPSHHTLRLTFDADGRLASLTFTHGESAEPGDAQDRRDPAGSPEEQGL